MEKVRSLRRDIDLPVAVGFGISTPEQVSAVAEVADGVVVGSALVDVCDAPIDADLPLRLERAARRLFGR